MKLTDSHGRVHDDLRISVTDRCNLRCAYCMPEDPVWFSREGILRFEEIERLVRLFVRRGVRKVRITGGEPLLRRDLYQLVRMLRSVPGIEDLSLTTNGMMLRAQAETLARAGVDRVNVSLDTLDRERFVRLTRREGLERTLDGIAAAIDAGMVPVKVNAVMLRDINDDEVEAMVAHARDHGWEMRFIEFMPMENGGTWERGRVVTGEEVRRRIDHRWPLTPDPLRDPSAPATRWIFRDGRGAVGFINSVSEPFCGTCSRIRLTADGKLRVCLYDDSEVDLRGPLRAGETDERLESEIDRALAGKGPGGALEVLRRRRPITLTRTMHQIGG